MISERELRRIAGRTGLGVGQAEHEYVLLCVLDALARTPPLAETFCLKGGTALRLIYFADWRHSVDLDFSVLPAFPSSDLRPLIETWFAQVETIYGVEVRLSDFHLAEVSPGQRASIATPEKALLDLVYLHPGGDNPAYLRELRLQNLEPA